MSKTLSPAQTRAVSLLAAGMTKTQCATEVKVSRETLHQWLKLPDFANALHQLQQRSAIESFNRSLTMVDDAIDCVFNLMVDPETPPNTKLSAASKILDFARTVHSDLDMGHRLAQVEIALGLKESLPSGEK